MFTLANQNSCSNGNSFIHGMLSAMLPREWNTEPLYFKVLIQINHQALE